MIVEAFVERVNSKEHIEIFMKKASLSLKIQCDEEYLTLIILNGFIKIDTAQKIENPDVFISGTSESLTSIIEGKETLRKLEQTGKIKILSTFRNMLFLETLFILGKEKKMNNLFNQKFQINS